MLIADIFITTKSRPDLLAKSLAALSEHTSKDSYRLTIIQDGSDLATSRVIEYWTEQGIVDHTICHKENMGLAPSMNDAVSHIQSLNEWFDHKTHGDKNKVAPFICYIQDDVVVMEDMWLEKMAKMFILLEKQHNLGFASGVECVEHTVGKDLKNGMILKPWIRASNMFARREYWTSMMPIPRFDPETGRVRAKPNDGMGSGVDWWLIRNHENSVCRTGRTNLVFPGMMVHNGFAKSTWLARELPESEKDKNTILKL